ncbi:MAG: cell division topological specificity factor MinE [Anaerolineales bacterium]|nr:cell division topological specificity factor MinE [Anaerolineales bacterium]
MSGLFDRFTGRGERSSAKAAKERLIVVLNHDRSDIGPGMLEKIKNDIIRVLSEHIDLDPDSVQVSLLSEGREQHLKADIPLPVSARRKRVG